jgi:pyruvate formate lyase activating enzyme
MFNRRSMIVVPIETEQSAEAVIFDIQCFSLHDGPGIRTTVFFKGCPLDCLWCHNPESKSRERELMFHAGLCVGCMLCAEVCPYGVHRAEESAGGIVHRVEHKKCKACGRCLEVCCYDALTLLGRTYTPGELFERIQGDLRYFSLTGKETGDRGGITFSGGEPMLYRSFIRSFCGLIPGVHRAMETSGYAPREYFEDILDSIDLFLFDYKVSNPEKHRNYCGVDNGLVLENLEYLYSADKKIVLRLPLIPGFNDDKEHFDSIADILLNHPGIEKAEVMAYHSLGAGKARELGLPVYEALPPGDADNEVIRGWIESLRARGCANVFRS